MVLGGRITAMRLWIVATSSFGSPVMIVNVSNSEPSGDVHVSHSPAKPKGCSSLSRIRIGCLSLEFGSFCHS